jgi:predicted deacylase
MLTPVLVLLGVLAAASPSAETVTIGTAAAKRGERAYGAIAVPAGSDAATSIPVAVIRGANPGPTLALVAGSHGTEYASVIALTKLIARVDPHALKGTAIVAPLVNVPSFEQMTVHLNPVDKKSMNGSYPGDAAGTQTQRALALVAEQIVKPADAVVDLHGGDLDEDLRPYSYWERTGDAALDERSKALALAFGMENIILLDADVTQLSGRANLTGYALSLGKPVVIAEAGRVGVSTSEDVDSLIEGCLNVMGALKMLDRPVAPVPHPVWIGNDVRVRADGPGMFFQTASHGDYVMAGGKVGFTTDYLGRPTGDVLAPVTGIVTFIRGVPSTWKGAALVNVGIAYAEPPAYKKPER